MERARIQSWNDPVVGLRVDVLQLFDSAAGELVYRERIFERADRWVGAALVETARRG